MKKTKIVWILCFVCALVLGASGCAKGPSQPQTEAPPREEGLIIRDMVNAYRKGGADALPQVQSDLEELEAVDEHSAEQWRRIMNYWEYANTELPINADSVPQGLAQDSRLCIVVLGFQLNSDGSMQPELIGRLERALECFGEYPSAYVLCTGGPTASADRSKTEAGEMAAWLLEHGVPEGQLLREERSMTTTQNAKYSWELLHERCPEVTEVLLVTSSYHIPWGAVLLETQCILMEEAQSISVVSNAAYVPANAPSYSVRSTQASGILELAGLR